MKSLPEGVFLRGDAIHLRIPYQNKVLRPVLKGLTNNKTNIAYAGKKRVLVMDEIHKGTFDWDAHFPSQKPPKGVTFRKTGSAGEKLVSDALDELEAHYKLTKAFSTVRGYSSKMKHIKARFGDYRICDLVPSEVSDWIELDMRGLANKTINDTFTPFRAMLTRARKDMVAAHLSVQHIDAVMLELTNLETENDFDPDPFTTEELVRILNVETPWEQEVRRFLFACHSGLAASEITAYGWEDVDIILGQGRCQRAKIEGRYKVTKSKRRTRTLEHTDQALAILREQKAHTFMLPAVEIEVLQRDNRTIEKALHRPIFVHSKTRKPHQGDNEFNIIFMEICRKAGVRYRGANYARHTFISRMLTIGMDTEWIITQTGHSDDKMIRKHYGKYLHSERPDMAKIASERLRTLIEEPHAKKSAQ